MAINYDDTWNPYDTDLPAQEPYYAPAQPPQTDETTTAAATTTDGPTPNPSQPTPGTELPVGSLSTDPNLIRQHVLRWGAMAGADPSLSADPDYWVRRIIETGGLGHQNAQYWMDAGVGPTAFFRNPNRESGGDSDGGGDTTTTVRDYGPSIDDWFAQNGPAMDQFTTPSRPDYLNQPYQPERWTEEFKLPSIEELNADPGFLASEQAMQRGMERSAAAKGSVLSGGFVGRTLPRALGEHALGAYDSLAGRAFDTYKQRYGQFLDRNSANLGARAANELQYQTDVGNAMNQYQKRYQTYRDTIGDSFDLARLGLDAVKSSRY